MSMQVYTYPDKEQRDKFFQELRASEDPNERQVVKFSGVEPVLGLDGAQLTRQTGFRKRRLWQKFDKIWKMKRITEPIEIPIWRSTWSVAHPLGGE